MKKINLSWLNKTLFETGLIVFAVVLGFVVNEWRQELREAQKIQTALARIKAELSHNREMLIKEHDYHKELSAKLANLTSTPPSSPIIQTFMEAAPRGLGSLVIRDDAWLTALSRGTLDTLDFETVEKIGMAYRIGKLGVQSSFMNLAQALFGRDSFIADSDGAALSHISMSFWNLVAQEKDLIFFYEQALQALDDNKL